MAKLKKSHKGRPQGSYSNPNQTKATSHTEEGGEETLEDLETIETAMEASQKTIVSRDKEIGEGAERPNGPVGLDIGTSHIVIAQNVGRHISTVNQLNAFFTIPYSKFTKKILIENEITFFEKNDLFYILGYSAENFANMFNTNTRRTMERGLLTNKEDEGINVLQSIIKTLIAKPDKPNEIICFSLPGNPADNSSSVVYHESILKMFLASLGYRPISINEGLATVMAELANDNFTGLGISMGGGMCNICLSYLSVPVLTFSIQRGGDYVDNMVSASVGEPATRIKLIKENSLDLSRAPQDRIETALAIYYVDLISHLLETLEHELKSSDKMPNINNPIPIALSGGTVLPAGFKELFEKSLKKVNLPVEISDIRISDDPLNTTAKGAMVMALSEEI